MAPSFPADAHKVPSLTARSSASSTVLDAAKVSSTRDGLQDATQPMPRSLPLFEVVGGGGSQGRTAPLTGRSSSSTLETPRTGGGYTARSSGGERGTPRDPQRLPLGARPHGCDAWIRGDRVSPEHTARSAAESSQAWPTTPGGSSRGEGSARSDAFCHNAEEHSARAPAGHGVDTGGHGQVPLYQDLARELEIIRHVVTQENGKLKEHLHRSEQEVAQLREQVDDLGRELVTLQPAAGASPVEAGTAEASSFAAGRALAEGPSLIEWHIRRASEMRAAYRAMGDPSRCECAHIPIPEFPGVDFALMFYPLAAPAAVAAAAGAEGVHSWRLALHIAGSGACALDLRVALSIEVVLTAGMENASGPSLGRSCSAVPGSVSEVRGGGRALLRGAWPQNAEKQEVVVICRAEVTPIAPLGNVHRHESVWQPPALATPLSVNSMEPDDGGK